MFNLLKSPLAKTISAEEFLRFDEHQIRVERQAFRRRISLGVALNDQIRVCVAKSTSQDEIFRFLNQQKNWIENTLEKNSNLRLRYPRKRYFQGETFLFFGRELKIRFEQARSMSGEIFVRDDLLVIGIPDLQNRVFDKEQSHPEMAKPMRDFYRHQGRGYIKSKTKEFSEMMRLFPKDLSFRSQKTRWGSCSARGHVSFNWRLVVAPKQVVDYVIVHELAHLRHHNHSKNFWNLVEQVLPDYKKLRKWLKDNQYEADFLAKKSELWLDPR